MKDRFLKRQLEMYADAAKLEEELLADAYKEMDIIAERKAAAGKAFAVPRKSSGRAARRTAFAAIAAAFILVVALILYPFYANDGELGNPPELREYTFTALSRSFSTEEEINGAGGKFLALEEDDNFSCEFYVFKNRTSGTIYVAAAKYKVVRQNGSVDEVVVISDLMGGLTDYADLTIGEEGIPTAVYDIYIDGEYYSHITLQEDGKIFYLFVTSPDTGAAYAYEEIIF